MYLLLLFLLPVAAFGQAKADYEKVMNKFAKLYNNKQGKEILKLWGEKDRKSIEWMWSPKELDKLHSQYGKIKSVKYIGKEKKESNAVSFQTIFAKLEPNGSILELSKDLHIYAFMLVTSEPKPKASK